MRHILLVLVITLMCGCAPAAFKMYSGSDLPRTDFAVISALGLYPESRMSLQIKEINGKPVNDTTAAEFHVLAGDYKILLKAFADFNPSATSSTWKDAFIEVSVSVENGHTYIPNFTRIDDKVSVHFDDKGVGFKKECLPLYQAYYKTNIWAGKAPDIQC
ncbi:hypothetical protein HPT27_04960 [Permianibacter sp. IMCC34836]|uniref:hypothetical protein n=1 Tax=Permianibacter fluminis TaxID=2738515 RepID=UPI001553541E|nr:hypothetical protein [Permianibacter fluminis]NQD36367.1 hypothetical protein [Permianibacter fluminis]